MTKNNETSPVDPVDQTTDTLRYLRDLEIIDRNARNHGYLRDRVGVNGSFTTNEGDYLRVQQEEDNKEATAKLASAGQGRYEADMVNLGELGDVPFVDVKRAGHEHSFSTKNSKRAAELVFNIVNKRAAQVGHDKVAEVTEQARVLQEAKERYEKS
jgi:hypothetical protein